MFTNDNVEDFITSTADLKNTIKNTPESELPFKYDLQRCYKWIEENRYQKTCLQFPGPLLNDGTSVALYLQNKLGRPVYLLADTSYGSCCVDEVAAQHVDADSIIHFGHACLSPVMKLPVLYVFEKGEVDLAKFAESVLSLNEYVVVFYDDVYHHLYPQMCSLFQNCSNVSLSELCLRDVKTNGRSIMCGRAYLSNPDQTIGVYIGGESVTLQNLVLGLPELKWYQWTEEEKLVEFSLNQNKFLMQRSHLVEKIKSANVIGILFGTLGIKNYLEAVDRIKLLVKERGKKCYMLAVGKPNVAKLANFPEVDVFVCIACEENALLKDFKDYYKPVVSLYEIEMALGDRPYSTSYTSDFRQLLPGGAFYEEMKLQCNDSATQREKSQDLLEKDPGTITAYGGAQFLANRSWRGLEITNEELEVSKAVKGRSGIPQAYENELETLTDDS